jgi:hypothetical protein
MMIASSDKIPTTEGTLVLGQLEELERIRVGLRRMGNQMVLFTAITILNSLFILMFVNFFAISSKNLLPILNIQVLLCFYSIFSAVRFDQQRRRGEIIFDEISDELQSKTEEELPRKIDLATRITLRTFVQDSNLPLIQGPNAAAVYLIMNLSALVLSLLFLRP